MWEMVESSTVEETNYGHAGQELIIESVAHRQAWATKMGRRTALTFSRR